MNSKLLFCSVLGNKHLCLSSTFIDTKLKRKFPVTIVAPIASIAAIVVMIILLFVLREKMSSSMDDFFQHYVNVMHVLSYILAYALLTHWRSHVV